MANGVVVGGSRERGDGGEDRHLDKKNQRWELVEAKGADAYLCCVHLE